MNLISKKYYNISKLAFSHLIVVAGITGVMTPCQAMEPEETNDNPVVSCLPRGDYLDRGYINGDAIDISATQGWLSEFDNAHGLLGKVYQDEKKYEDAAQLFHCLALKGSRAAKYEFALMCKKGEGVEQNYTEAAKWFRLAAEQGHSYAQYEFGLLFSKEGLGVEPNDHEAAKWCQKAAEQGYVDAQYWFGLMHQYGQGVERSYKTAIEWYLKAAIQGHTQAQEQLEEMNPQAINVPSFGEYPEELKN